MQMHLLWFVCPDGPCVETSLAFMSAAIVHVFGGSGTCKACTIYVHAAAFFRLGIRAQADLNTHSAWAQQRPESLLTQ